jgi:hypothetical protein
MQTFYFSSFLNYLTTLRIATIIWPRIVGLMNNNLNWKKENIRGIISITKQKFDWRDIIKCIRKISATVLCVRTEILTRDFPNAAQCYQLTSDARFQTFYLLDTKDLKKKCHKNCGELCSEFMYTWHMARSWYTTHIDIVTIDVKASRLVSRCRINVTRVHAGGDS